MRNWLPATTLVFLVSGLVAARVAAQEDEESPYRPGLVATYSAGDAAAATRIDEAVAFDWAGASPDPRLPDGQFAATWRGRLWTQSPGAHRLAVFVQGQVSLKLDGKEIIAGTAPEPQWLVSSELDLPFDYHPLELTYRRTGDRGQLALFWTGPNFVLEPIPQRFLFHDRTESPSQAFERGRQLAAALRCAACHQGDAEAAMPAPALDRLSGNISREWLVAWLAEKGSGVRGQESAAIRRMPHLGISQEEALAIADWLFRFPTLKPSEVEQKGTKDAEKSGKEKRPKPSAESGEQLFLTLGCLACHQHGSLGESGLFGGGDLTKISAKRPAEFFSRWLVDPASLNKHHRMPVFELSTDERTSLSLWLAQQGTPSPLSPRGRGAGGGGAEAPKGETLIARFRCAACHTLPGVKDQPLANPPQPLNEKSNWSRSCAGEFGGKTGRPGYQLPAEDQSALKAYFTGLRPDEPVNRRAHAASGRDLLVQLNCLACHQREGIDREVNLLPARLQDKLLAVAEAHSDLAKQIPAMTPPALNSVGDKLQDKALADAIRRQGDPHRPYLLVRMPKFNLTDEQLASLTAYFVSTDRIPRGAGVSPARDSAGETPTQSLAAAGPRLVTTDGFGCTSCHQVGSVPADKAPINARGPNLSLLEKRIRREWFDRWCYSPARLVPRMEMPSVQVPVRGVLGDNVHDQLAAVWHTLNTPGFEPPEPNPIRVLRLSGVPERKESPIVLHDVVKDGDKTYLFPLVIGLPNRHNILFDLETNRLAAWWLGDTARQRTKGKSWWWEQAAESILTPGFEGSELTLVVDGKEYHPRPAPQFAATVDYLNRSGTRGVVVHRELEFAVSPTSSPTQKTRVRVFEILSRLESKAGAATGFERNIGITGLSPGTTARIRFVSAEVFRRCTYDTQAATLTLPGMNRCTIQFSAPSSFKWNGDGSFDQASSAGIESLPDDSISVEYRTGLPVDQFVIDPPPRVPAEAGPIQIAPGFVGRRLPLPDDIMPSALAWKADGRLVFATLKGQVFVAADTDGDILEDQLRLLEDGLATPYGLTSTADHVDVLAKFGLIRLVEVDDAGIADRQLLRASGWGVTDDYHDWAIGLARDDDGAYYIGLPCQQDKRTGAAAKHRGQILKLVPRQSTADAVQDFNIEVVSSGHRFPMGLARNRDGDLFVTDNQGNYNPFNELNHVRSGKHFGFINANEKEAGFKPPPLEEPAINIPHPWTRSVNGICFLDTPEGVGRVGSAHQESPGREKVGTAHPTVFGPLEGHLIGCEYDTRRLIRMTLQKIGDTYQGAAYPLSIPPDDVEKGLLGPIVCAVSPRGELYVGEIRDSGWGAGNNVGQIVKIKIEPDKLPCGIAEMKATVDGFTLDFFQPVDAKKSADAGNYSLQSYRRESTPAYGGPDLDRRTEKIAAIEVAPDKKRVTLKLPELRERFVYELRLKNLAPNSAMFHPDEAHFTLRQVPK